MQHLHHFLTIFDVAEVCDGDPIAGANTLAPMAESFIFNNSNTFE